MFKIGDRVQANDTSYVGADFRGLVGHVVDIRTSGDGGNQYYYVKFNNISHPLGDRGGHGGSWQEESLSLFPWPSCGECESEVLDKDDYLCNTCRDARSEQNRSHA